MTFLQELVVVGLAGLVTDLATGLGVVPFMLVDEFTDRWLVRLWGLAAGIMLTAAFIGLLPEGWAAAQQYPVVGTPLVSLVAGLLVGVLLVAVGRRVVDEVELEPGTFDSASFGSMVLILGVLTVHSFPEGVAIGVSFVEMGLGSGFPFMGVLVPPIAVTMTVAIAIHNIPEGTSIAIPFRAMGASNRGAVAAAVFSSLPQPIGAVLAYAFVAQARAFLAVGYGFAAGAMIYLVVTEFITEALEEADDLPYGGWVDLTGGGLVGTVVMVVLFAVV